MVAYELKVAPQDVREWALCDLVGIASDILTRADLERYELNKSDKKG